MISGFGEDFEGGEESQQQIVDDQMQSQQIIDGEQDDEDVIDIDNPDDLAAKGLRRI